jgi:hypothetical protein
MPWLNYLNSQVEKLSLGLLSLWVALLWLGVRYLPISGDANVKVKNVIMHIHITKEKKAIVIENLNSDPVLIAKNI